MAAVPKSLRVIFDEASEIEAGEQRRVYLDEACHGDTALRANVEELLRAQETAGGFLADPKREATAANAPVAQREGDRLGRYQLLRKIGEGGCGVVYLAEQIEPVRRHVALKIIKLGMDILVTRHDGPAAAGVPKIIDFGIAKAIEARLTDATVRAVPWAAA